MSKNSDATFTEEEFHRKLHENFWQPSKDYNYQADFEEFNRLFGLMPEFAEFLGVRQFLREDTLNSVN